MLGLALSIPRVQNAGLSILSALRGLTSWLDASHNVYSGGARQFYAADKTSLEIADNAALSTGDIDFTLGCYVYFDGTPSTSVFIGKLTDIGSPTQYEYALYVASGVPRFLVSKSGVGYTVSWSGGAIAAGKWYFIVGWHDSVNNTIHISVNDVSNSVAHTVGVDDGTHKFVIGGETAVYAYSHTGRVAKAFLTKKVLSTAERTYLYNLGNGRLYAELGIAGTDGSALLTSMSGYWNLNEPSGTSNALDAHSTNDLVPTFGELLSNTGFETAGGGGADVFGSWTEVVGGTGTVTDEGVIVDAGSHAAKLVGTGGADFAQVYQAVLVSGRRYNYSLRARNGGSGVGYIYIGQTNTPVSLALTSSYATYSGTGTANGTRLMLEAWTGASTFYADTVSCKAVDIPASDGPASDVASDSIGSAHGVLTNFASSATAWKADVPTPLSGTLATCLEFDGTNDHIVVANATESAAISVSMWVKFDTVSALQWLYANGTGVLNIAVTMESDGKIGVWPNGGGVILKSASALLTATWYHVVVTRSGSAGNWNYAIYINGALSNSSNTAQNPSGASYPVYIGWMFSTGYFDGRMSDVRKYVGTTLNLSQVGELYAGTEATGATPTARWKLDDGPQSTIGTGDSVVDWRTYGGATQYQFLQASASKRPLYDADAFGVGVPGIDGDGTDDILVCPTAFLSGTEGTVIVAYLLDAVPNTWQVALGSSDESSTVRYVLAYARGNTASSKAEIEQRNNDTPDGRIGSTTINVSTKYIVVYRSNGTAWSMRVNGVNQTLAGGTNSGDWWDDASSRDNTTVLGWKYSSELYNLNGKINKVITSSVCLTDAECAEAERLIATEIGVTL